MNLDQYRSPGDLPPPPPPPKGWYVHVHEHPFLIEGIRHVYVYGPYRWHWYARSVAWLCAEDTDVLVEVSREKEKRT